MKREASDKDIADRFADVHGHRLRYDFTRACWYLWDGCLWGRDETERARALLRDLLVAEYSDGRAKKLTSAHSLAIIHDRLAVTNAIWDQDPMMLGTPDGVIDLRTGQMLAADPMHHVTLSTRVAPVAGSPRQWLAFLAAATNGDEGLLNYLQVIAGYVLTGAIREHAMWFIYGRGGTGKGTFLETLAHVAGDYAYSIPVEELTAARSDRHPAGIAAMKGKRLVFASETEKDHEWAIAKIKRLTGGDQITARFMNKDFFTFSPTHKLVVMGNHPPAIPSVDESVRRRFSVIPFDIAVPDDRRDKCLPEKLRAEAGQILVWALAGARIWLSDGLGPAPKAVRDATDRYFEEHDIMGAWLAQCIGRDHKGSESGQALYGSWRQFREARGESHEAEKVFSERLRRAGFDKRKSHGRMQWHGLFLRTSGPGDAP